MTYIKQFDAVRALAVILVIIYHWVPRNYYANLPLGGIGVDVFFVLSGFLITRILLYKKTEIEESDISQKKTSAVWEFMMRRALRIFPVYYLILLVLFLGANFLPNPIPKDWVYYGLYLQNFLFYFNQSFQGGKVAHLWSLAVEEQFYLIWPWIIFFINKKYIKQVLLSGVIIGTLSSLLFPLMPGLPSLSPVLTICCLQSFCLGGLLSYWSLQKGNFLMDYYPILKYLGLIALFFYLIIKLFFGNFLSVDRLLVSVVTVWAFAAILLSKTENFRFLLENKILISIGKISYGIYVFHNFIPVSLKAMVHLYEKKMHPNPNLLQFINNPIVFYLLCISMLWYIAYFSFIIIEKPFLRLKNKSFAVYSIGKIRAENS